MEVVELQRVGSGEWRQLQDGEEHPWGPGEAMQWLNKERHLGIRAGDGRLVALAGTVVAEVEVDHHGRFPVLGVGSVIVTRSERGRGLARVLLERTLALAATVGPQRAMLFCRAELTPFYGSLGFEEISDPVWVDQPEGRIEMPMRSMWRPLGATEGWPPGRVDVVGLPF
jgi:predicted GNAT family N-acyltransferase